MGISNMDHDFVELGTVIRLIRANVTDIEETNILIMRLKTIPALRQKMPETGHWLRKKRQPKSYLRICSVCGKEAYFCGNGDYPRCPYCTAIMKRNKEDKQ